MSAVHNSTEEKQQGGYIPLDFTESMSVSRKFNLQAGQLNKPTLQARIGNEYVESSRKIQGVVTSSNEVGQIFKASKDNITGLYLTLESSEGVIVDDFESYADSTALQTVWSASGSLATLETGIVKNGTQSMALPGGTNGSTWTKSITATDYTNYTGDFDAYFTKSYDKFKVSVFIGDGTNTKSQDLVFNAKDTWNHFEINEAVMTEDQAGTTNVTAITRIGFKITDPDGGEFCYIDNLAAVPPPGEIGIELWDMGLEEPMSGLTKLSDGTRYEKLNGDQTSVSLQLKGGKRMYHLHNEFKAGNRKNEPTNELLNIYHYYILRLKYVDTDVSVYGPDTSFNTNYYINGYAFTTPDSTTAITAIGQYSDIMFGIQSMQDIYVTEVSYSFDTVMGSDSDMYIFGEDTNMGVVGVVVDHKESPEGETYDISNSNIKIEDGGKMEFYLNNSLLTPATCITISMKYSYKEPEING